MSERRWIGRLVANRVTVRRAANAATALLPRCGHRCRRCIVIQRRLHLEMKFRLPPGDAWTPEEIRDDVGYDKRSGYGD